MANELWFYILLCTNIITFFCLLFLVFYDNLYKKIIWKIVEPKYCKTRFLKMINHHGKLLDVGCGNNSPYSIKTEYPNIHYTGIDVGDYNQTQPILADNYIITAPDNFHNKIAEFKNEFNTVISSHNLEHCNDRYKTLEAITNALKTGGYLFLSFPTEASVNFPGPRAGCLNYYDDGSHKDMPPDYKKVIAILKKNNLKIMFARKSYKPFLLYFIGFLLESKSKRDKEVKKGTWAYWGFETIIWAKKK